MPRSADSTASRRYPIRPARLAGARAARARVVFLREGPSRVRAVQTYIEHAPDRRLRLGVGVWREMARELRENAELIQRLCLRDLAARYRQSLLGVAWGFVLPLALMLVFVALRRASVLPIAETGPPYAVWVYAGILVWQLFSRAVTLASQSIVNNLSILSQVPAPGEVFVLAAVGQAVCEFLMGLPALAVLCAWHGLVPHWAILWTPALLLALLAAATGIGLLLGLVNAALRDVGAALPLIMLAWMLATPVIYPPSADWPWRLLAALNPVAPLLCNARSLALEGQWLLLNELLAAVLLSLTLLLASWRLFHILEPRIAERL